MHHFNRLTPFLDLARDLKNAADIPGGNDLRAGAFDLIHLALAEALGHLRLSQVVCARCAAAELGLGEWYERESGDHAQKATRLFPNALGVAEVARVMIRHRRFNRILGRN